MFDEDKALSYGEALMKVSAEAGDVDANFTKFIATNQEAIKGYSNAEEALAGYDAYLKASAKSAALATVKTKALSFAAKAASTALSIGFSIAINLIISKISREIDKLKNATKDYREEQEKLIREHEDRIQGYTDEIDKLNELHDKLVLAKNDRSALAEIYDDLNKAVGVSTELLSGESAEYETANQKILDRIKYLKQLREEENKDKNKDSIDYFKNNSIDVKSKGLFEKNPKGSKIRKKNVLVGKSYPLNLTAGVDFNPNANEYLHANSALFYETGEFQLDEVFGTNFTPYISEEFKNKVKAGIEVSYQDLIEEIMKQYSKKETKEMDMGWLWSTIFTMSPDNGVITESEFDDYLNTQYETVLKIFDDFINSHTDSFSVEQSKEILKGLVGLHLDDFDSLEEDFKKIIDNSDLSKAIDNYYKSLSNPDIDSEKAYNNLFGVFEKLKNEYPTVSKTLDDILLSVTKYTNKVYSSFGNIQKQPLLSMYSKLKDQLTLIANAEKELAENGELSIETVISLIEKYPELESKLTSTATGYSLASGTLQELINSERTEYTNVYENAKKAAEEAVGAEYLKANAYDGTTKSLKNQIEMRLKLYETEMSTMWTDRLINSDAYDSEKFEAMLKQYRELQNIWGSISSLDNAEENIKTFDDIFKKIRNSAKNSAKSSTDAFDKELKALKHSLAMEEITERQYYSKLTILNNKYFKGKKEYLDEYNQYIEEIYSGEKKMQEEAVSAIESLRNLVADMIKQELNDQKKALEDELDSLNKILDARKKALELAKEQNDYEKNLAEKNKAVADIEAELISIRYDTSASGIKKRLELEEKLADTQTELDKFLADHAYDTQINEIEKEKEALENSYNEKTKALEKQLDDEAAIMKKALETVMKNNNSLYFDLINWNTKYGDGITKNITEKWNAASRALSNYSNIASLVNLGVDKKDLSPILSKSTDSSSKKTNSSTTPSQANSSNISKNKTSATRYYTIKKGDTLWNIAKEYYGNGKMWSKIFEANPGLNIKNLKTGQKLIIPFKTGGETGNYEGIGYLHKKERVLSVDTFSDYVSMMCPQIKN